MNLPPLSTPPPSEIDSYMIVTNQLLPAIEALSVAEKLPARACAMLAAHALECALKAIIKSKNEKHKFPHKEQHNLIVLWDLAASTKSLDIQTPPPDWVRLLSTGHGPHFYFRYQEGEEPKSFVHGGQTPALVPMAQALRDLVEKISDALK